MTVQNLLNNFRHLGSDRTSGLHRRGIRVAVKKCLSHVLERIGRWCCVCRWGWLAFSCRAIGRWCCGRGGTALQISFLGLDLVEGRFGLCHIFFWRLFLLDQSNYFFLGCPTLPARLLQ